MQAKRAFLTIYLSMYFLLLGWFWNETGFLTGKTVPDFNRIFMILFGALNSTALLLSLMRYKSALIVILMTLGINALFWSFISAEYYYSPNTCFSSDMPYSKEALLFAILGYLGIAYAARKKVRQLFPKKLI